MVRVFTQLPVMTCIYPEASSVTVSRGVLCILRSVFLLWPLWIFTLHPMVGETCANGRYAVYTSLPHFMFGHSGNIFMVFLGNGEFFPLV